MLLSSWKMWGWVVGVAISSAQLGCGGTGDPPDQTISGTWVSQTTPGKRGTLELSGKNLTTAGAITGTLVIHGDGDPDTSDPITGSNVHVINVGSTSYNTLDIKTADGQLSLFGTLFDELIGTYQNDRTGDSGAWHEVVSGTTECVVDRMFQTDYTLNDLAFDGVNLFAVARSEVVGSQAQLVRINPTSGAVSSVNETPACPSPSGIAFDGSVFLVTRQVAGTDSSGATSASGWFIDQYDASWQQVGAEVKVVGSSFDAPAPIAWYDGKLWYAGLLSTQVTMLDPTSGTTTTNTMLRLNRPAGFEIADSKLWSATFPPGGVWPTLVATDVNSGVQQAVLYSPENKSSTTGAITAEPGFLWVACGHNLYRLKI